MPAALDDPVLVVYLLASLDADLGLPLATFLDKIESTSEKTMTSLGTRVFWRPLPSARSVEPQQILKMSSYVSITLHAAHYHSSGNFWQSIFGGTDRIALTTTVTYRYGDESVSAQAIQDAQDVSANNDHSLSIGRFIALKLPADADGIELSVDMTAIEDDNLSGALDLLNNDDFRKPLELAPPVLGEVLAISSLVKHLFTSDGPHPKLHASYPGILSTEAAPGPYVTDHLAEGYLILIATETAHDVLLDQITEDPTKLEVTPSGVRYNGAAIRATHLVFCITADHERGLSTRAAWYKKFRKALLSLNAIEGLPSDQQKAVYAQAIHDWQDGVALLEDDPMYLPTERASIAAASLADIHSRAPAFPVGDGNRVLADAVTSATKRVMLAPDLRAGNGTDLSRLHDIAATYKQRLERAGLKVKW